MNAVMESNLMLHAERELRLAEMYDEDADYGGGAIAKQVLDLMRVFASQGHSGGSAMLTLGLFERLARYQTISPNDHSEYIHVIAMSGTPPGTTLQDSRDSTWFSNDSGATWYCIEDRGAPASDTEPQGRTGP